MNSWQKETLDTVHAVLARIPVQRTAADALTASGILTESRDQLMEALGAVMAEDETLARELTIELKSVLTLLDEAAVAGHFPDPRPFPELVTE